jgi:hypothetical protein
MKMGLHLHLKTGEIQPAQECFILGQIGLFSGVLADYCLEDKQDDIKTLE